ncbi:hypothetical protein PF002_g31723, partial [Phytophthora fragariae]
MHTSWEQKWCMNLLQLVHVLSLEYSKEQTAQLVLSLSPSFSDDTQSSVAASAPRSTFITTATASPAWASSSTMVHVWLTTPIVLLYSSTSACSPK